VKFLLASLKTLTGTSSKSCSESRIKVLFRLSFALIGQFFLVYIHSLLSPFGTIFRITGGFGTESWNKLSEEGYWKAFHN
jgi:hypothetical protein